MFNRLLLPSLFFIAAAYYIQQRFYSGVTTKTSMTETTIEDPYQTLCRHTDIVHKVLRRGLHQLEKHAQDGKKDLPNFMGYALAWLENLDYHHQHEDTILFPTLRPKFHDIIARLEKEHEAVETHLETLRSFCTSVVSGQQDYEAAHFLSLVKKLKDVVLPHLKGEEEALTVAALKQAFPDYDLELKPTALRVAKQAQKDGSPFTSQSFLFRHLTDDEFGHMFARVPFFVRSIIFPVFPLWNSGYWKYASTSQE